MSDASTAMAATTAQPTPSMSSRAQFWARMFRNPLTVAATVWVTLLVVAWIWPSLLAPHDPYAGDVTLTRTFEGPSWDHWLGTDAQGRDFYSRVVHGARFAVTSILVAMVVAVGIGVPLGLYSGWRGGRTDRIVMWLNDVLFSLPIVLLAMAVIIILEPSLVSAMLGVGIAMATRFARLTRAVTLAEKEELYVDAARISGLSPATILRRYITPNLLPSLIVQIAIISGAVILIGTTLSFWASAPSSTTPTGESCWPERDPISEPRVSGRSFPPGGALVLTVLAFNLLGDAIRDSLDGTCGATRSPHPGNSPFAPRRSPTRQAPSCRSAISTSDSRVLPSSPCECCRRVLGDLPRRDARRRRRVRLRQEHDHAGGAGSHAGAGIPHAGQRRVRRSRRHVSV